MGWGRVARQPIAQTRVGRHGLLATRVTGQDRIDAGAVRALDDADVLGSRQATRMQPGAARLMEIGSRSRPGGEHSARVDPGPSRRDALSKEQQRNLEALLA